MSQKIVIVGFCASGKSTIAEELGNRGYDAHAVSQEHSIISDLWKHSDPDVVIFLDVDLETVRQRRGDPTWPEWLFETQRERLQNARKRADILIDTSRLDKEEVLERILQVLRGDDSPATESGI